MLLGVGCYLLGQAFTSLNGTVADPTGAVVPGATITITNVETGAKRDTTTDSAGRYTFVQILPGTYRLTAKSAGFTEVIVNDIRLLVNSPATVPVTFEKVGAIAQVISVEATAIAVNTQDATLGNAIGTQAITQLPFFARNVAGLLAYQPGVTSFGASDDREGSVNGGKSDQANVTLDGAAYATVTADAVWFRKPFGYIAWDSLDELAQLPDVLDAVRPLPLGARPVLGRDVPPAREPGPVRLDQLATPVVIGLLDLRAHRWQDTQYIRGNW